MLFYPGFRDVFRITKTVMEIEWVYESASVPLIRKLIETVRGDKW